jgi:hypothetical protein
MRRVGPAIDNDAWEFAKGKPCGASWISMDKNCRKGGEGESAPSRKSLNEYWQGQAEISEERYNRKLERAQTLHTGEKPPALVEKMKPYTKLSSDERAAVQMYGAEGVSEQIYNEMNARLRMKAEPSPDKKDAVDFATHHLKAGIEKLPDTKGEFYRAVSGGGAKALAGVQPGDVIQDNGFGSYADRGGPRVAPFLKRGEENIVMIVQGKTFKDVSPVMPYQEGEHLARPGTKLRLTRIEPEGFYNMKVGDVPAYYFEEV